MTLISLVTPTCERPEAMSMLNRWVERMQVPRNYSIEWIVCTDSLRTMHDLENNDLIDKLRRTHKYEIEAPSSLQRNMLNCLEHATGEWIAVLEDDDWYRKDYLVEMMGRRNNCCTMIVANRGLQYNVKFRRYKHTWEQGWTWARTIFHQDWGLDVMGKCAEELKDQQGRPSVCLDKAMRPIWADGAKVIRNGTAQHPFHVSIAGMPGTPGVMGFHTNKKLGKPDPMLERLALWCGTDSVLYQRFYEG